MSRLNQVLSNVTCLKKLAKTIYQEPMLSYEQKQELIIDINNKILMLKSDVNQKFSYFLRRKIKNESKEKGDER